MATYVIADIHGEYNMFLELLEKIGLKPTDTLYILGDVIDRGPYPVRTLRKLMEMPNVICMAGNHEIMALECLEFLMKEITEDSLYELDGKTLDNLATWLHNGCRTTIDEFRELDLPARREILDFIQDMSVYEEVSAGEKEYLLVHAGLGNFSVDKALEDYSLFELVWERADYNEQYFPDKYVITGHTPTQLIRENPNPGYIFRHNNHIAIDCGACFSRGRLAAICLDTGEEFYSSPHS